MQQVKLLLLLSVATTLNGGGACVKPQVAVYEPREERENAQLVRRREIERIVEAYSTAHITSIYQRLHVPGYANLNLSEEDQKYFRECVIRRFEENESGAKEKKDILIPLSQQVQHLRRQKRLSTYEPLPSQTVQVIDLD